MAKKEAIPTRDWSDWQHRFSEEALRKVKFGSEEKMRFLEHYGKYGRKADAARAAGVCTETVNQHIKNDPAFALAVIECKALRADRIEAQAWHVAVEGVDEPIVGGEFKDEVVAHKKVYATNILAMLMKQSNPEYREKSELDLNATGGGVLVVPAMLTPDQAEEALKQFADQHQKEPGSE